MRLLKLILEVELRAVYPNERKETSSVDNAARVASAAFAFAPFEQRLGMLSPESRRTVSLPTRKGTSSVLLLTVGLQGLRFLSDPDEVSNLLLDLLGVEEAQALDGEIVRDVCLRVNWRFQFPILSVKHSKAHSDRTL